MTKHIIMLLALFVLSAHAMGPLREQQKRNAACVYLAKCKHNNMAPTIRNGSLNRLAHDAIMADDYELFTHCAGYMQLQETTALIQSAEPNSKIARFNKEN